MRSYWFKVGSTSMTGVIIRRGTFGNMETHKEESHVTRQAEKYVSGQAIPRTVGGPQKQREAWIQFCLRATRRN